jgi:hypothetical protein
VVLLEWVLMSVSWNILAGCVRTKIAFVENSFTTEDAETRSLFIIR